MLSHLHEGTASGMDAYRMEPGVDPSLVLVGSCESDLKDERA